MRTSSAHQARTLDLTDLRIPAGHASRAKTPWCAHTFRSRMGGRARPRAACSRNKQSPQRLGVLHPRAGSKLRYAYSGTLEGDNGPLPRTRPVSKCASLAAAGCQPCIREAKQQSAASTSRVPSGGPSPSLSKRKRSSLRHAQDGDGRTWTASRINPSQHCVSLTACQNGLAFVSTTALGMINQDTL